MRCLLALLLICLSGSAFAQAGRFIPVVDSTGKRIGFADTWAGQSTITLDRSAYGTVADAGAATSATEPLMNPGELGWISNADGSVALRSTEAAAMDAGLSAPMAETVATDVAVSLPELASSAAEACFAGPIACIADIAATALIARDVYYDAQQRKWMKPSQAGPLPPAGCTGSCAYGEFGSNPGTWVASEGQAESDAIAEKESASPGNWTIQGTSGGLGCNSPPSNGTCSYTLLTLNNGAGSTDTLYVKEVSCDTDYYWDQSTTSCLAVPTCPGSGEVFDRVDGQCYSNGAPVPATQQDLQNAFQKDVPQGAPSRQLGVDLTNAGDPLNLNSSDPVSMTPTQPVQTVNGPTSTTTDPSGHTLTTRTNTQGTLSCSPGSVATAGCSLSTTQTTTTCDASNNCTTTTTTQGQTQQQQATQQCGLGGQMPCNVKVIDDSQAPTLGDAKTFQQSTQDFMTAVQGAPLVTAFSGITMPTGGSCPTYTYNVPYINFQGVMNAQCVIAEEIRPELRIIMLAIFGLWAVRIFLEA